MLWRLVVKRPPPFVFHGIGSSKTCPKFDSCAVSAFRSMTSVCDTVVLHFLFSTSFLTFNRPLERIDLSRTD